MATNYYGTSGQLMEDIINSEGKVIRGQTKPQTVMINGIPHTQIGNPADSQIWNRPDLAGAITLDPTYGYVVPEDKAAAVMGTYNVGGLGFQYGWGPFLGSVAAGVAPGLLGATAGAAGSAVPLGAEAGVGLTGGLEGLGAGVIAPINSMTEAEIANLFGGGDTMSLADFGLGDFQPTMFDDFFPEIMNVSEDVAGNAGASIEDFYGSLDENWPSIGQGAPSDVILPSGGGWLDTIIRGLTPGPGDLSKFLLGTNSQGGTKGIFDIFGDRGLLGTGLAAAPALAAINYAKNTAPFDTSRLESLYSGFNPQANAFQYDVNTGLGREQLTSNLARRGIAGSSFGNADLLNYNTGRDLGRQALVNQGVGTQANIANSIIDAQAKERALKNQLYGSALLAMSGALTPRTAGLYAPFGG